MKRILGNDLEALKALKDELGLKSEDTHNRALVYLLLAILLRENGDDEEMKQALSKAKSLAPECPLTELLDVERVVESLPLPGEATWLGEQASRRLAKEQIDRSVELKGRPIRQLALSSVVAYNLPLTKTFADDVYAYVLLKSGNLSAAEKILEGCLREDSTFHPSYLHFGELHLAQAFISRARKDSDREKESLRAGELCLWMAIFLEGHEGHTTKRARKLLAISPTPVGDLNDRQAA